MSNFAFNSDEQARLARGKYTRWATGLSDDDLLEVLAAIGDFSAAAGSRLMGDLPRDANIRLEQAIFALLGVVFLEGSMFHHLGQVVRGLDEAAPPDSEPSVGLGSLQGRLEQDPRVSWAAHLSPTALRQILWLVGECGCRLESTTREGRSTDDERSARIEAALESLRDSVMRPTEPGSAT